MHYLTNTMRNLIFTFPRRKESALTLRILSVNYLCSINRFNFVDIVRKNRVFFRGRLERILRKRIGLALKNRISDKHVD